MKTSLPALSLLFAASVAVGQQEAETPAFVEITGDRVNLRATPKPDGEVVAQASLGETFVLRGDPAAPWVAVAPPARCDLWIRSDLLVEGKVRVDGARLRAGAGVQHSIVGSLPAGTPLEIRGSSGDWLRVAPPDVPGVALHVTNAYVKAALPKAAEETPPPPPPLSAPESVSDSGASDSGSSETVPEEAVPEAPPLRDEVKAAEPDAPPAPPRPVPPPAPAAGKGHASLPPPPPERSVPVGPARIQSSLLDPDRAQAAEGEYAGLLAAAPTFGSHPTRFRLVRFDRGSTPETVCWVYGNTEQLRSLSGYGLTVCGAVYWFKDCDLPVVFAQEILKSAKKR